MIKAPLEVLVMKPKYKTVSVTKDYQIRIQRENFASIDALNNLYCSENIKDFAIIYHNDQSLTLLVHMLYVHIVDIYIQFGVSIIRVNHK